MENEGGCKIHLFIQQTVIFIFWTQACSGMEWEGLPFSDKRDTKEKRVEGKVIWFWPCGP